VGPDGRRHTRQSRKMPDCRQSTLTLSDNQAAAKKTLRTSMIDTIMPSLGSALTAIEPCIPTRAASRASKHGRPGMSTEPTILGAKRRRRGRRSHHSARRISLAPNKPALPRAISNPPGLVRSPSVRPPVEPRGLTGANRKFWGVSGDRFWA
jgi:hypothetical protein